jgi:hypothetical protein
LETEEKRGNKQVPLLQIVLVSWESSSGVLSLYVERERERERERENQADQRGGGLERETELETGGVRSVFLEDGKYNAGSCGTWNSNAGSGGFCQASAFAVVVVFPWW